MYNFLFKGCEVNIEIIKNIARQQTNIELKYLCDFERKQSIKFKHFRHVALHTNVSIWYFLLHSVQTLFLYKPQIELLLLFDYDKFSYLNIFNAVVFPRNTLQFLGFLVTLQQHDHNATLNSKGVQT